MIAILSGLALFVAATCITAYAKALDRAAAAEAQADALGKALDDVRRAFTGECAAHDVTASQLERARQAASDNLTSLCVVLDAHARDIVQDPLGTDLLPDESLALVKP